MIRFGVITVSDKGFKGEREDLSVGAIKEAIKEIGAVSEYALVPDEEDLIEKALRELCAKGVEVLFTTGGTGFSPRDVTPEATNRVIERNAPGIAEAMRYESMKHTNRAMLSRAVAGIKGKTLIINLPGSPKAVAECIAAISNALPHAVEILTGKGGECAR